jgi:histidinol-phosphate aminotransferase
MGPKEDKQMTVSSRARELLEKLDGPSPAPWLDSLSPYDPVSSLVKIWDRPKQRALKLDWNESTIPPSPKVYQAIVSFLSHSNHLNWYPELGSFSLAEALSDYVQLPTESILVTNGSDDALELVCKSYLAPGDRVLVPMPTYTHFLVYVQARNATVVPYFPDDIFDPDFSGLAHALEQPTKMVYLVNPNNPTGVTYDAEGVAGLLAAYPETLFVVDEAYFEFHGESAIELVSHYANLVVTRTFSKCFGIAGLRMGYLCAAEPILRNLRKIFNPKSVNRLGQIGAAACLSDLPYYEAFVREVTASKEILVDAMNRRGLELISTPANFVLLRVEQPLRFCSDLEQEGVYVRDRSTLPRLENFVRISVPNMTQTYELIERIDRVLDRRGQS